MDPLKKIPTPEPVQLALPQSSGNSWFWFAIQTALLGALLYTIIFGVNFADISMNWQTYRCNPTVMPFAGVFGHDAVENFNYCMQNIFNSQTGSVTGPFSTILSVIMSSFMTFLQNINSIRLQIATFLGGIQKILQEFVDRFKILFNQIRTTSYRIQFLMKRVYATFFAIIYMGVSGMTGAQNFGDTVLFKFLDFFCFAPETVVQVVGKGRIPISSVELGDILESSDSQNSSVVTAIYRFMTDGQPMVTIPRENSSYEEILVSSNHYIRHKGKWIRSEDHPGALTSLPWDGGAQRPLICLDTHNHEIPIGSRVFSDYMETNDSDEATMRLLDSRLNGRTLNKQYKCKYESAIDPQIEVKVSPRETRSLDSIQVGTTLMTGTVIGTVERIGLNVVKTDAGLCSPSTNLWDLEAGTWTRCEHMGLPVKTLSQPMRLKNLFVLGQASFELSNGTLVRDGLEVYSPDIEQPTADLLLE